MLQGGPAATLPLHEEGTIVINGDGPGRVGLGGGADGDPVPRHKAAGAVLVQAVESRAEGQQLPGNGPGQRRPADRGWPAREEAARCTGQLFRPVGGGGGQVEPNAHHQPFQQAALHAGAGFRQDAADLFALIVEVVDPLDAQLDAAELLHSPGHGHGSPDGDAQRLGGRHGHPQHQRKIDALARRALESAAHPAPARALLARQHQRAMRGPGQCQPLGRLVAAVQPLVDINRCGVLAHGVGAERVPAQQPVAPAGGGFQRVPLRCEGGSRLVDGRPAHPQRLGQLLAGDVAPLRTRKCLQQGLFCGNCHGGGPPCVI